jgi:hypothetical protein
MQKRSKNWISRLLVISLVAVAVGMQGTTAFAATLTNFSDILSNLQESTASNHEVKFASSTGITTGQTIIMTFTGFNAASVNAIDDTDIDVATGSTGVCSSATYTEIDVGAANGAAQWGVSAGGGAITLTAPSGGTPLGAGLCLRVEIGTNATNQVAGAEQITNGTAATSHSMAISGGTFADTGTLAVDIIEDDQVTVTATVAPSITFTINDTAIGFAALSFSAATWANAGATGSAVDTSAHNLTVATNAASGYTLSYYGATLTSGANTIDAATITDNADGTPGNEEFAIGVDVSNSSTIATGYDHNATAGNRDWSFVPSTTTTLVSRTTPTGTETINAYYLANISATTTAAGSYSTDIDYIATATF